ncbi:MAG: hypothetical protein BVN35_20245 [Proteobacteria bacterium ST_bin11]|jgi:hypothetical protein|nr:MAG: hypothetical protein BVN35_20245 [Proteobacteria bacterium ST_bin11]
MLKFLFYALLSLAILVVGLLFFAIDDTPLLKVHHGLNREDIQRAKQLLHVLPDERGQLKTVSLDQNDLNIAVSYLLNHFAENTTQIQIVNDRLIVQIAVFVPKSPWGRYLDFSFNLRQTNDTIVLKSLKIGEISIPDPAANFLIPALIHNSPLEQHWQVLSQYVKNVRISPHALEISYLGSIVDAAKQLAIQKHRDYPNLHRYQQQINEIVSQHDPDWRVSITDLLQPLFLTAYEQTLAEDAIQENRAIIIAVGSYIYKHDLRRYLPLGLVYSKEYPVFAYKRIDIPQHFIASALLAIIDSSLLGEQIGIDKELGDAQKGSGFSFIDLAADRTGTRFGQIAIASVKEARELQRIMSSTKDYSSVIPELQDLPENMDEKTFASKFKSVESPAYNELIQEIDARIIALPLYQITGS